MAGYRGNIVKETITLTKDGTTGYTSTGTLAGMFGRAGRILRVVERLDGTLNDATEAAVIIADDDETGDIDANTPDEHKVYESAATAQTGSATAASLDDNVATDGGAWYSIGRDENLKVALNVTATAGGTTSSFEVTVWAEVYQV